MSSAQMASDIGSNTGHCLLADSLTSTFLLGLRDNGLILAAAGIVWLFSPKPMPELILKGQEQNNFDKLHRQCAIPRLIQMKRDEVLADHLETPSPRIDTPYRASDISIVRF